MVGEDAGIGGGMTGDSYGERSSMARVRASGRDQVKSLSGKSPMQQQPHSQQSKMIYQSNPPPSPPPLTGAVASVASHKSNQDKALITLLEEMRGMEKKMDTQAAEYEAARQQLQHTIDQQKHEIDSLQQSNQQLEAAKHQAEHTLQKVLTQLNRFSVGCWQFPSNSVKKMSEALHAQLQEWKRTIGEEVLSLEDEFLEISTMEKMQQLHLVVKKLRAENKALKKEIHDSSSRKTSHHNASDHSRSTRSGLVTSDDDDLISNLSGMSSTVISGMLESPRMKDAMKGFLHSPVKSRNPTTRRGKGSPTSILKQSSRYDSKQDDINVRRSGYQQRSKSTPSLPPRLPHMSSSKKVARFAGVDGAECDSDWGDTESEV